MSTLYENIVTIGTVLVLAGLGLIVLGAFGRVQFPHLGGLRTPWHDLDFLILTEKRKKVCVLIGGLLWLLALFLCVLTSIPGP